MKHTVGVDEGRILYPKGNGMRAIVKCFDGEIVYIRYLEDGKDVIGNPVRRYTWTEIEEIFKTNI